MYQVDKIFFKIKYVDVERISPHYVKNKKGRKEAIETSSYAYCDTQEQAVSKLLDVLLNKEAEHKEAIEKHTNKLYEIQDLITGIREFNHWNQSL